MNDYPITITITIDSALELLVLGGVHGIASKYKEEFPPGERKLLVPLFNKIDEAVRKISEDGPSTNL